MVVLRSRDQPPPASERSKFSQKIRKVVAIFCFIILLIISYESLDFASSEDCCCDFLRVRKVLPKNALKEFAKSVCVSDFGPRLSLV